MGFGGPPGFGPGGPGGPFGGSGSSVSRRLFGSNQQFLQLNHLWFLWYLLIFASIGPALAKALGWAFARGSFGVADQFAVRLIHSGFAPIAVGVVCAPALAATSGPFGWSLGMPASIFRAFPDFLWKVDPEMGFFLVFFMAGWLLHRERDALPRLSRGWLPDLLVGVIGFAAASWLSDSYMLRTSLPYYQLIRWGCYALYSAASAATCFAFVGFFQRFLDKPTTIGRYLADTALWVYLVHQPLVILGLAWLVPLGMPWWVLTAAVAFLATSASLFMYEALVRPTPLVKLFGPASARIAPVPPPTDNRFSS